MHYGRVLTNNILTVMLVGPGTRKHVTQFGLVLKVERGYSTEVGDLIEVVWLDRRGRPHEGVRELA